MRQPGGPRRERRADAPHPGAFRRRPGRTRLPAYAGAPARRRPPAPLGGRRDDAPRRARGAGSLASRLPGAGAGDGCRGGTAASPGAGCAHRGGGLPRHARPGRVRTGHRAVLAPGRRAGAVRLAEAPDGPHAARARPGHRGEPRDAAPLRRRHLAGGQPGPARAGRRPRGAGVGGGGRDGAGHPHGAPGGGAPAAGESAGRLGRGLAAGARHRAGRDRLVRRRGADRRRGARTGRPPVAAVADPRRRRTGALGEARPTLPPLGAGGAPVRGKLRSGHGIRPRGLAARPARPAGGAAHPRGGALRLRARRARPGARGECLAGAGAAQPGRAGGRPWPRALGGGGGCCGRPPARLAGAGPGGLAAARPAPLQAGDRAAGHRARPRAAQRLVPHPAQEGDRAGPAARAGGLARRVAGGRPVDGRAPRAAPRLPVDLPLRGEPVPSRAVRGGAGGCAAGAGAGGGAAQAAQPPAARLVARSHPGRPGQRGRRAGPVDRRAARLPQARHGVRLRAGQPGTGRGAVAARPVRRRAGAGSRNGVDLRPRGDSPGSRKSPPPLPPGRRSPLGHTGAGGAGGAVSVPGTT